jgi:hypothetical protein
MVLPALWTEWKLVVVMRSRSKGELSTRPFVYPFCLCDVVLISM